MMRGGGLLTALVFALAAIGARLDAQQWKNATGTLAYKVSECGNLGLVTAVPNSSAVIAGVAGRGLWINTSGTTWSRLSDPQSVRITNRPESILFDPENPAIFWETGSYHGAGLYKTIDGGKTYVRLGTMTDSDYISADFSDPDRRTLVAGGHEQPSTVYRSLDGGQTWSNIGRTLPRDSGISGHPLLIDPVTYLVNVLPGSRPELGGIYRTRDGGNSWLRVSPLAPEGPPLRTTKNVIYWTMVNQLLRSTDLGASWVAIPLPGLRPIGPVELPENRVAVVGRTSLLVTADGGATWVPIGGALPFAPGDLAYSAQRGAFFISQSDCGDYVLPNAVMQLDFPTSAPSRP